jgi:hypothetical protein
VFGSRLEHHIACGGHEPQGLPSDFGGSARRPRSVQLRPLPLPLPGPRPICRGTCARAHTRTHAPAPPFFAGVGGSTKSETPCVALSCQKNSIFVVDLPVDVGLPTYSVARCSRTRSAPDGGGVGASGSWFDLSMSLYEARLAAALAAFRPRSRAARLAVGQLLYALLRDPPPRLGLVPPRMPSSTPTPTPPVSSAR